jgi:hypothetical protein
MEKELIGEELDESLEKNHILKNIIKKLGGKLFLCNKNNFEEDLKFGEEKEKEIMIYLEKEFKIKCKKSETKDYDIYGISKNGIEYTFEVKYDRIFNKTKNIAIEYLFKGNPSGISISKANYFIFYNEKYIIIEQTEKIRKRIKENKNILKIVYCGDNNNSKVFLLNEKYFKIFFSFIRILKK